MSVLHAIKLPWKIAAHNAARMLQPRLEAGERITLLIEYPQQAGLIRNLLPLSTEMPGFLRIAMASEVGPKSLRRFQDSEVISITKCRECQGAGGSNKLL